MTEKTTSNHELNLLVAWYDIAKWQKNNVEQIEIVGDILDYFYPLAFIDRDNTPVIIY